MGTGELIESFLGYKHHNAGCATRTVQIYRSALDRLIQFLDGRDPMQASTDDLVLFAGPWLHKQGIVAAGRRPYIAAVREFYKWAARRYRPDNPAAGVSYPKIGKKLPIMISLANAERLMWAPDFTTFEGVRDGSILGLMMGCGFRVAGLAGLNESNIAHAELKGEVRMVIKVKEKGEKERLVPVPKEAEMLLRVYLEHTDLKAIDRALSDGDQVLFVTMMNRTCPDHEYRGERRRMSTWAVRDMMKRYGKKVGIPPEQLHPHAARHLFGTELTESDVDMLVKQDLLGHADPKSTQIYTHLAVRKKIEESDRANPLGKMRTPVSELLRQLKSASRR